MNVAAFRKMLAKQSEVIGCTGNQRLADEVLAVAEYFADKTGTVTTVMKSVPANGIGGHHETLVRIINGTAEVHRGASAKSAAGTACVAVAKALGRTAGVSITEALTTWQRAAGAKPKRSSSARSAASAPREEVVTRYLERLTKMQGAQALEEVERLDKDKKARHTEIKLINARILGAAPKRSRKDDVEALRRHYVTRRALDEKSETMRVR